MNMYIDVQTVLVFCITLLVVVLLRKKQKLAPNLPPGPYPWPIIGSLAFVMKKRKEYDNDMARVLTWLGKEYGNVLSLKLGSWNFVILNGYQAITEALVHKKESFSGRPTTTTISIMNKRGHGVLFSNEKSWKNLRRFALMSLRDFGVGKKSLEYKILEEMDELCQEFERTDGKNFTPNILLNKAVSNVICSIMFGDRFDYNNPTIVFILKNLTEIVIKPVAFYPENMLPWINYVCLWESQRIKTFRETLGSLAETVEDQIVQHRETYDANNLRDVVDLWLQKIEEDPDSDSITRGNMNVVICELFIAGSETTGTTLRWAIFLMSYYEDIQEKVQLEIKEVFGNRYPAYSDRCKTPYIEAVLAEIHRYGSVVPLSIFHYNDEDAKLMGYDIPAGSILLPNLYSCHFDAGQFPQPHAFQPTRWLDENGTIRNNDYLLPFSLGPRVCLGENLARMETYLFFVGIFQRFKFTLCEERDGKVLKPNVGTIRSPPVYNVRAEKVSL